MPMSVVALRVPIAATSSASSTCSSLFHHHITLVHCRHPRPYPCHPTGKLTRPASQTRSLSLTLTLTRWHSAMPPSLSLSLSPPPISLTPPQHSGGVGGTTNMPMPVSQGASWNISMVEDIGRINALELRSSGGDQGLSPILQVCTDPRFSRMEENFGGMFVPPCAGAVLTVRGRDVVSPLQRRAPAPLLCLASILPYARWKS